MKTSSFSYMLRYSSADWDMKNLRIWLLPQNSTLEHNFESKEKVSSSTLTTSKRPYQLKCTIWFILPLKFHKNFLCTCEKNLTVGIQCQINECTNLYY